MKPRILLTFLLLTSLGLVANAQLPGRIFVSVQTQALAIPFTTLGPVHPGGEIGLELWTSESARLPKTVRVSAGGFYSNTLLSGFTLRGVYGIGVPITDDIVVDLEPGLGYLHSYFPAPIYAREADGTFAPKTQLGRPHLTVDAGLGMEFFHSRNFSPYINYRVSLQTPFISVLPVLPHTFLAVGVRARI